MDGCNTLWRFAKKPGTNDICIDNTFIWVGLWGVLFAYLIPLFTSRGYLVKGAFYGLAVGIVLYAIPTLYQTPYLTIVTLNTTISNHIGGILWGLTMAQVLGWLDRIKIEQSLQ